MSSSPCCSPPSIKCCPTSGWSGATCWWEASAPPCCSRRGQTLIGYYLANFITANIYGAAGGIIVLLIWVYYSAQIFLLGAEFTKVWAEHYGSQRRREWSDARKDQNQLAARSREEGS